MSTPKIISVMVSGQKKTYLLLLKIEHNGITIYFFYISKTITDRNLGLLKLIGLKRSTFPEYFKIIHLLIFELLPFFCLLYPFLAVFAL